VAFPPADVEEDVELPPFAVCDWVCFCCCFWLADVEADDVLAELLALTELLTLLLFDAEFAEFVLFTVEGVTGGVTGDTGVGTQMNAIPSTTS
jgi:hypothetical protein